MEKSLKLAIVILFALTGVANADVFYCADGFGTTLSNGTYTNSGASHNGYATLTNGVQFIDVVTFTGTYYFSLNETGTLNEGTSLYYWEIGGSYGGQEPSAGTWLVSTGSEPAGTVISGSCDTPTTTPTTTMVTVNWTQPMMAIGWLIMTIVFFGTIWVLTKNHKPLA